MASKKLVLFQVEDRIYGMDMNSVASIEKQEFICDSWNVPEYIDGAIAVRGEILPVYNLRGKLGLVHKSYDQKTHYIIVTTSIIKYAMAVDCVDEILEVEEENYHVAPALLHGEATRYVEGIANKEGQLILVLQGEYLMSEGQLQAVNELVMESEVN